MQTLPELNLIHFGVSSVELEPWILSSPWTTLIQKLTPMTRPDDQLYTPRCINVIDDPNTPVNRNLTAHFHLIHLNQFPKQETAWEYVARYARNNGWTATHPRRVLGLFNDLRSLSNIPFQCDALIATQSSEYGAILPPIQLAYAILCEEMRYAESARIQLPSAGSISGFDWFVFEEPS